MTGTFIIPTFTPVGDSSSQGAVAFVSIGAADCGTGDIFVAGVIVSLSNSSEVTAGGQSDPFQAIFSSLTFMQPSPPPPTPSPPSPTSTSTWATASR